MKKISCFDIFNFFVIMQKPIEILCVFLCVGTMIMDFLQNGPHGRINYLICLCMFLIIPFVVWCEYDGLLYRIFRPVLFAELARSDTKLKKGKYLKYIYNDLISESPDGTKKYAYILEDMRNDDKVIEYISDENNLDKLIDYLIEEYNYKNFRL